ncbi:MAG TPA: HAD-IC family P-type ATPase [Ignavibacteria bacterium]|nr:HAD-IC family P-type ATPase [Ignavibacteria bacterium]
MNITGLNTEEVNERISKGAVNKTSRTKTKTIREIFIENIFSVFNYIIFSIILAIIYFYYRSGDHNLLLDSMGIVSIALLNTLLAIVQEIKAKKALDKVNLLLKKEALVIRNGIETEIGQEEIVEDDVILMQRGDQAPVDGKVIYSNHLEIDESLLTGESIPIRKKTDSEILSGSFCVSGSGYIKAEKVGDKSYANSVTEMAKKYKFIVTPLQRRIDFIVKMLFCIALFLIVLEIFFDPKASLDNVSFIRKMATILISLVPQGLVLMTSVTFALGVYRISRIGAIIQKLNAIESFSNVKIVCMDKTGTLTQNKLSIENINFYKGIDEKETRELIGEYVKLTSDKNATIRAMESLTSSGRFKVTDEIPFSSETKMSLLKVDDNGKERIFILGGFDILNEKTIDEKKREGEKIYSENNLRLYRTLMFGEVKSEKHFESSEEYIKSISVEPYCIISISDQARDDVMDAIKLFQSNGINFKILSGDASFAIQAIADKIGWQVRDDQMITGSELEKLSGDDFKNAVNKNLIFARLKPEHKLEIIKCLRGQKIYTAMIGDGVNDLPAIKEADMGIAMEEGSQITKEIADIVLLKNKFSLLPEIFNEGNKIVNTVTSISKLFLTKNFIVIYSSLLSLIFALEFALTPRRIALINIFIIGLPSFIIALKNSNLVKPKKFLQELFSFVFISAFIIVVAGYAASYTAEKVFGISGIEKQMVILTAMIITSMANFYAVSIHKGDANNKTYFLYGLLIISIYLFLAATQIDFIVINLLKTFYEITYLNGEYWFITISIGVLSAAILFTLQLLRKKYFDKFY